MSQRRLEHDIFGTTPRPDKVNGKNKGNMNERVAAKFLSDWTGAQFNRTPSSGGMHLKNQLFCGDLVCITEGFFFPFVVETKHLKSLAISPYLRDNSVFFKVFQQAERDAARIGKRPMCLIRPNRMAAGDFYLVLDRRVCSKLGEDMIKVKGAYLSEGRSFTFRDTLGEFIEVAVFQASKVKEAYSWERFCSTIGITGSKKPR